MIESDEFRKWALSLTDTGVVVMFFDLKTAAGSTAYRLTTYHETAYLPGATGAQRTAYTPSGVRLKLPSPTGRQRSSGRISLGNADREYVDWIREQQSAPIVSLRMAMDSKIQTADRPTGGNPQNDIWGPFDFRAGKITYDADEIVIPLVRNDFFTRPFQTEQFDPARTPALYV